jgi:protein-L-isoaspartate O-methyltransferase
MHTRTPHSAYPLTDTHKHTESESICTVKVDRPRRDHISSTHGTYSLSLSNLRALKARQKKNQHAHAVELLLPYLRDRPAGSGSGGGGARVLDVGAGSGYLTSVFYQLVFRNTQPQPQPQEERGESESESERTSAVVVGIEHIPALAALAEKNIRADGLGKAIDERGIVLVTGDGRLGAFASFFFPPLSLFPF